MRVMVTDPLQVPESVACDPSSSSRTALHDDVVAVTFDGTTVKVGGVVSPLFGTVTVTVCVHEALVPVRLSVAVQVI